MALAAIVGSLARYHVVVVDDHADSRTLLRTVLEHEGAAVSEAATATDAVQLVETEHPDLVVTDIGMEDHDGVWLFERIQTGSDGDSPPVVAVTGYKQRLAELTGRGFALVLIKPVDPFDLARRIAALLDGH